MAGVLDHLGSASKAQQPLHAVKLQPGSLGERLRGQLLRLLEAEQAKGGVERGEIVALEVLDEAEERHSSSLTLIFSCAGMEPYLLRQLTGEVKIRAEVGKVLGEREKCWRGRSRTRGLRPLRRAWAGHIQETWPSTQ
jgi:hypothetical protein